MTDQTPNNTPKPWKFAILAVIVIVGVGIAFFVVSSSKSTTKRNLEEEFSSSLNNRSFKAYKARPVAKKKPMVVKKRKPPKPEDQMTEEEKAAWKLAESTGQDVVYEDPGEDPKPAAAIAKNGQTGSLLPTDRPIEPFKDIDDRRRKSRSGPNDKQRSILRALNQKINNNPKELQMLKVDSAANRRLKYGLPYKLKPIKRLPINPNPPSWTPPKVKSKAFLPDVYGGGPMPEEGVTPGTGN